MDRLSVRLRKVTGSLQRLDHESVGRAVAAGWLRAVGVAIDPRTGTPLERDWQRMRAEASGVRSDTHNEDQSAGSSPVR